MHVFYRRATNLEGTPVGGQGRALLCMSVCVCVCVYVYTECRRSTVASDQRGGQSAAWRSNGSI